MINIGSCGSPQVLERGMWSLGKQNALVQLEHLQYLKLPALKIGAGSQSGNLSSWGTFLILNLVEPSLTDELTLKTGTGICGAPLFWAFQKCRPAALLRLQEGDKGPAALPVQRALFTLGQGTAPCYSKRGCSSSTCSLLMQLVPGQANDCSSDFLF